MKYLERYDLRKRIGLTLVLSLLVCIMFHASSLAATEDLHNAIEAAATSETRISATAENIFTVPDLTSDCGGNALQGGIKVGQYLYTAYVNSSTNASGWIVKYDMEGNEIARTAELNLGHANDIAYNSKLDRLVLAHCAPVGNQVSIIDHGTLTIEQTYYISQSIYCIDYNATQDQYVVGINGGQKFQILNSNFTPVNNTYTVYEPPEGADFVSYVTQGCTSDDKYIYFGISDYAKDTHTGNYIAVYNWSGEFQTVIHIPFSGQTEDGKNIAYEIEYLYIEDGVIYFGTNNKTYGMGKYADLYKVIM